MQTPLMQNPLTQNPIMKTPLMKSTMMRMPIKFLRAGIRYPLVLFFLIAFFGRADAGEPISAERNQENPAVFGHLILDWRSDEIIPSIDRLDPMTLTVVDEASERREKIVCEPGGSDALFFARLPPGRYRVTKWSKGEAEFKLPASFEVPPEGAVYIGTIQWVRIVSPLRPKPSFSGMQRGRLAIADLYDEEAALFKERHPEVKGPVVKSILEIVQ